MKWQRLEGRRVSKMLAFVLVGGLALVEALAVTSPVVGLFLHAARPTAASRSSYSPCPSSVPARRDRR
jgi:hypothetical protein